MPGSAISCHSLISLISALDNVRLKVFMVHGDVALAMGTDNTKLVVVLPDVIGYGGGIPTIFTAPRAKDSGIL